MRKPEQQQQATRNEKATVTGTTPIHAETTVINATRNEKAAAGTTRNAETGTKTATRNEKAKVPGTTPIDAETEPRLPQGMKRW